MTDNKPGEFMGYKEISLESREKRRIPEYGLGSLINAKGNIGELNSHPLSMYMKREYALSQSSPHTNSKIEISSSQNFSPLRARKPGEHGAITMSAAYTYGDPAKDLHAGASMAMENMRKLKEDVSNCNMHDS